jgi:erythromycin esterase
MAKNISFLNKYSPVYSTINDWIQNEAIPFSVDSFQTFNAAVDKMTASFGDSLELLGFGEALHGGKDILNLRNRLFYRLVERYGFSAIAVESSFPRGHVVNEYVAGRSSHQSYEAVAESGFSHGFGRLDANRELVEWMRVYNADSAHQVKLRFYGFDSPTEMSFSDSPRQILYFVLDYLCSIDGDTGSRYRNRIDPLLGADSDWENPAAMMDPTKSIGCSPAAATLRIETENLITELRTRRPELVAKSDESRYLEAIHYARQGRQLLNYHAAIAQNTDKPQERIIRPLGIRDLMMADNMEYIVSRERGRGKVLAFAHNSHLQRGKSQWQLGNYLLTWWPAGSHLNEMLGSRYAVIGSAVGVSDANGIGTPEAGTLEACLTAAPGPLRFIATHKGKGLPSSKISALKTRSGSAKNSTYFALTAQSITDFDWLAVLDSTT